MSANENNSSESVSEVRYEAFARDTYAATRDHISTALKDSLPDLPVLVIVGESHLDTAQEKTANAYTADFMEEPALASAFTEISALEAAARLVGKENVVLSLEFRPDKFAEKVTAIRENGGVPPASHAHMPMMHTLAYAINNGFQIVPTDSGNHLHETDPEARDQMMIDSLSAIAAVEDKPKIVVHIGGSQHISNMLGFTNQDILDAEGKVSVEDAKTEPFAGFYGYILAYNTTQDTPQTRAERGLNPNYGLLSGKTYADTRDSDGAQRVISESRFYENPENAIQVNAPGAMDSHVQRNLGEMVRDAAIQYKPDTEVFEQTVAGTSGAVYKPG